jgi:hypothetical protein
MLLRHVICNHSNNNKDCPASVRDKANVHSPDQLQRTVLYGCAVTANRSPARLTPCSGSDPFQEGKDFSAV